MHERGADLSGPLAAATRLRLACVRIDIERPAAEAPARFRNAGNLDPGRKTAAAGPAR